ncbi:MAG TPA: class I SAM-dependent methyltransferase, partial [Solirubrobacteraceae bacterium]
MDEYVGEKLIGEDAALEQALAASAEAGLPAIAVSPPQGKLLALLVRIHGARNVLELGTLGGYSTIWMARALPAGGRLLSLELDPRYAEVAGASIERAGLSERVRIRVGPALETLEALIEEGAGPFDLVFIDADKARTPEYFEHALQL